MTTAPHPTPRDPVVEAVSEVLANILTRRYGGRWRAAPQWDTQDPSDAVPVTHAATTSPLPNTPKDTAR